jgi:hypothetical protein
MERSMREAHRLAGMLLACFLLSCDPTKSSKKHETCVSNWLLTRGLERNYFWQKMKRQNNSDLNCSKFNFSVTAILIYYNSQRFEHDHILKGLLAVFVYWFCPACCIETSLYLLLFHPSIHPSINGSTAFRWPWPLFQLLNPIHSRQNSLDGRSARRKAATYTQNNTNRINAHTHSCLEWDSNPQSQRSSEGRQFMP